LFNDPGEVRRKGLEPLQELPHWNLNPDGMSAPRENPRDPQGREAPDRDASAVAARIPADTSPRGAAVAVATLLREAAAAAAAGDLVTAGDLTAAAMALATKAPPTRAGS
jgi:hypothetical protein